MKPTKLPRIGLPPRERTAATGRRFGFGGRRAGRGGIPAAASCLLSGSYRSAGIVAVDWSSSITDPPETRTFPFGRIVAFISVRPATIVGPHSHFGFGSERSMVSDVGVAGTFAFVAFDDEPPK